MMSGLSANVRQLSAADIIPGEVYRLRKDVDFGYRHAPDYDEGRFIHIKVLSGPDSSGLFTCSTRGEDGQHLGPGGGWSKEHDEKGLFFRAAQLERIPASNG